jgi:hypothetical protein
MNDNDQQSETSPEYITILARTFFAIQKQRIMATSRIGAQVRQGRLTEREAGILIEHVDKKLRDVEAGINKDMAAALKDIPIYKQWFKKVKGVGVIIAGGMIGEITDISRFEHISNLWSWAGVGIHGGVADRLTKGKKATWNPHMKVLCWKLGKSIVMTGGWFRDRYDEFKREEIANNVPWTVPVDKKQMKGSKFVDFSGQSEYLDGIKDTNITDDNIKKIVDECNRIGLTHVTIKLIDAHVDSRARRKAAKLFLALMTMKWREIEGLPVELPYSGQILGHAVITPDEMLTAEEARRTAASMTRKARDEP